MNCEPPSTAAAQRGSFFLFSDAGSREEVQEAEARLLSLICCHHRVPTNRIGRSIPLNRLGLDSLALLHLAAAIDLEFDVYVRPEMFGSGLTLERLAELVAPQPPQSKVERLFGDAGSNEKKQARTEFAVAA